MLTHDESALTAEPALDGARLRRLRRERGLSAHKLAERANLCVRQIWRLEAGHRPNVRAVTVARIALALTTTMDYLMGLSQDPAPYPTDRRVPGDGCCAGADG
jgi:transcriptional regulator with XRE-family HTH domain